MRRRLFQRILGDHIRQAPQILTSCLRKASPGACRSFYLSSPLLFYACFALCTYVYEFYGNVAALSLAFCIILVTFVVMVSLDVLCLVLDNGRRQSGRSHSHIGSLLFTLVVLEMFYWRILYW
jgi:Mn2+/Fe2+ NRAMP family transporter